MTEPSAEHVSALPRYAAFISYRHADADRKAAVWLHRSLEAYHVPAKLAAEQELPARLGRVFRDEEELAASADLSRDIEEALRDSRFLIVVCSPRTPGSEWVNREVERFREMGRGDQILALLIEGEPAEAFPRALRQIRPAAMTKDAAGPVEELEPLAADIRPTPFDSLRLRRRAALLRLTATMLGVRFDDLRQREAERRHRRLAVISGVLSALLLLVGGLAFAALYEVGVARAERDRAVDARNTARQVIDDMISGVAGESLGAQTEMTSQQRRFLENAAEWYEKFASEPGEDQKGRERVAKAFVSLCEIQDQLGLYRKAIDLNRRAVELFTMLAADFPGEPNYRRLLGTCHHVLGLQLKRLGEPTAAEAEYRAAKDIQQSLATDLPADGKIRSDLAYTNYDLGSLLLDRGQLPAAEVEYSAALSISEILVGQFPAVPEYRMRLADSQTHIGILHAEQGRLQDAERELRAALASRQKLVDDFAVVGGHLDESAKSYPEGYFPGAAEYPNDLANGHANLGFFLERSNRWTEAEAEYRSAIAIHERLVTDRPGHPTYSRALAHSHASLGTLLQQRGRQTEAEAALRRTCNIFEKIAADHPDVRAYRREALAARLSLANHHVRNGEATKALADVGEMAAAKDADAITLYDCACVMAVASAAANNAAADPQGARAIGLLREAIARGYTNIPHFIADTDLAPLRKRPDYANLLWDLADMPVKNIP